MRQRVERRPHLVLLRKGQRAEVLPDPAVLLAREEDDERLVDGAPGTSHLLVVGDRRARRAHVDHEPEVGLVEAHAEGGRGDEGLDPVGLEVRLEGLPLGRVGPARVGGDRHTGSLELGGHLLGDGHGQAVDDPGPFDRAEGLEQPGDSRGLILEAKDAQVQRLAVEPTTQDEHFCAGAVHAGHLELLGDVLRDAGVGGRGGRQDGDTRGELAEQSPDAAVVGTEVVAPVRDAVRLVDDDQAGVGSEARQDLVAEARVVEALGRAEEDVDLPGFDLRVDLVPLRDVGRVDRGGTDAGPLGCRDLVTHEGEQGGDDDRGTGPAGPQERGGHEVHGRLAPAGALDHECAPVLAHESVDRGPLVVPQRDVVTPDEPAQCRLGLGAQVLVVGHDDGDGGPGRGADGRARRGPCARSGCTAATCRSRVPGQRALVPPRVARRLVEERDVLVRVVVRRAAVRWFGRWRLDGCGRGHERLGRRVLDDRGLRGDLRGGDALDGDLVPGIPGDDDVSLGDGEIIVGVFLVHRDELVRDGEVHELARVDRRRAPGRRVTDDRGPTRRRQLRPVRFYAPALGTARLDRSAVGVGNGQRGILGRRHASTLETPGDSACASGRDVDGRRSATGRTTSESSRHPP